MLSLQERILLVKLYYSHGESISEALRSFGTENRIKKTVNLPDRHSVRALIDKFEEHGTVENLPHSKSIDEEARHAVSIAIKDEPRTSVRQISDAVHVPPTTVWRILRNEMKLYPYRIRVFHQLLDPHKEKRLCFARDFLAEQEHDGTFLPRIWWSDESNFPLQPKRSMNNERFWTEDKCEVPIIEAAPHSPSVTVFIAFNSKHVTQPFFFEENNHSVSVTGERYKQMILSHLIPEMKRHRSFSNAILQQDGAPPHTANDTKALLLQQFGDERVIGKGFSLEWPPYSPDLSPCDYWLWNHVKSITYQSPSPTTLEQLKQRIHDACSTITPDVLVSVTNDIVKRLHVCQQMRGGHLEHILN